MFQHVENWKQSGLNLAAYCERQNIKLHTLNYWLSKSNKPKKTSTTSSFNTIEKSANIASSNYEMVYLNGVTFRIKPSNLAELSTLLKLV